MDFDVILIGGGASALMCCLNINNKSVCILEQDDRIGKKILVTGNGRCNLTNTNINSNAYVGDDISLFLGSKDSEELLKDFNELGLETYADEEGRVYPKSNYAQSVLDVLRLNIINKNNITVKTNSKVLEIKKQNQEYLVKTNGETLKSRYVVICAGGNFNFSGIKLDVADFTPALCSLKTRENTGLNGVRVTAKATLYQNGKKYVEQGEVLFKEDAISGICIFNLSLFYKDNATTKILLDFMPELSHEEVIHKITSRVDNFKNFCVKDLFVGVFHKALAENILKLSKVDTKKQVGSLNSKEIENIAKTIKEYEIKATGKENNNQIYLGGVKLDGLTQNLESKTNSGLFVAGEACNVGAKCGGFNLHWAFLSGKIIGKYINSKN